MLKPLKGQQRALGKRKPPTPAYCLIAPVSIFNGTTARSSDTYTWTCPETGTYKVIAKGCGGSSNGLGTGGASGSYSEKTRLFRKGETLSVVVALLQGYNTEVTFSDGSVMTAGSGASNTPGVASGGDLNLAGSLGGASGAAGANGLGTHGGAGAEAGVYGGGGGGAPGAKDWPGAPARADNAGRAYGAGGSDSSGGQSYGGAGGVMIKRVA